MQTFGIALQLVGALVTIWGLHLSKRALFGKGIVFLDWAHDQSLVAWRRVRQAWGWLLAKLGRKPPTQTVHVATSVTSLGGVDTRATATVWPSEDADLERRVSALEANLRAAMESNAREHQRLTEAAAEESKRNNEEHELIKRQISDVKGYVAEAIGGKDGRGLTIAAAGVAIAMAGTLLTSVG